MTEFYSISSGFDTLVPGERQRRASIMSGFSVWIRSDAEIGTARMPSDKETFACLARWGVPESLLAFRVANEFRAPGVYEQVHCVAGRSSAGAIKVEEEERGAGRGESVYIFCEAEGVELYLARFSGSFGELAVLARIEPTASSGLVGPLFDAMGIPFPIVDEGRRTKDLAERLDLHQARLIQLRQHAREWVKP
jgi:hypothetical protein